jgi:hypothetical protein
MSWMDSWEVAEDCIEDKKMTYVQNSNLLLKKIGHAVMVRRGIKHQGLTHSKRYMFSS